MKLAAVVMAVVLGFAILFAVHQGRLGAGLRASAGSALQMAPIFVLAFLLMGFMEVLLPRGWVDQWLSDASGWRGLVVAWLAGILTPGGSAIGMPVAAGLTATGASPAVLVTYLTSMATLNVLRMPIEVAFYGSRLMILRVAACLVVPFVAGGMTRLLAPLLWGR